MSRGASIAEVTAEFASRNFEFQDRPTASEITALGLRVGFDAKDLAATWELFYLNRQLDTNVVKNEHVESFKPFLESERKARERKRAKEFHVFAKPDIDDIWDTGELRNGAAAMTPVSKMETDIPEASMEGGGGGANVLMTAPMGKDGTPTGSTSVVLSTPGSSTAKLIPAKRALDGVFALGGGGGGGGGVTLPPRTPATPFSKRQNRLSVAIALNEHLRPSSKERKDGDDPMKEEEQEEEKDDGVVRRRRRTKDPAMAMGTLHPCTVEAVGPSVDGQSRYMFDSIDNRIEALDGRVRKFAEDLQLLGFGIPERVFRASQEPGLYVGRICCDGEGRLNPRSVLLEGNGDSEQSNGHRVKVDLREIDSFSIFPGQIVGIEGRNPSGHCLVASRIIQSLPPLTWTPGPDRDEAELSGTLEGETGRRRRTTTGEGRSGSHDGTSGGNDTNGNGHYSHHSSLLPPRGGHPHHYHHHRHHHHHPSPSEEGAMMASSSMISVRRGSGSGLGSASSRSRRRQEGQNVTVGANDKKKLLLTSSSQQPISIVVASGPFSTSDNLLYEPLDDLLEYAIQTRPNLLLLSGPFVDSDHPSIKAGEVDMLFEHVFQRELRTRVERYCDKMGENAHVALVPSTRDAHHDVVFPQPPFSSDDFEDPDRQITFLSNPGIVVCDDVTIGIGTHDILRHLSGEEASRIREGDTSDRMARLATHIIGQRSFYPLFPPALGSVMDMTMAPEALELAFTPDILILPSDLLHFAKILTCAVPRVLSSAGPNQAGSSVDQRNGQDSKSDEKSTAIRTTTTTSGGEALAHQTSSSSSNVSGLIRRIAGSSSSISSQGEEAKREVKVGAEQGDGGVLLVAKGGDNNGGNMDNQGREREREEEEEEYPSEVKLICINPGRLVKGRFGGTFARIEIYPEGYPSVSSKELQERTKVEILRI
ncbi:hypothetical protein CBR_g26038 [Chara braunii]|uniref:DNA polymerase alpha subunit B n=1 Tax=Chara braunii TaxID=69332 RepID=A0A388L703_CHABU|nr:hypothetical protein CBR_g26038 [Chara braunii]|eukprot:GBG78101.1 hypothetical protein CBR_g26038 [Chara braunii]